jgi:hypothetical protein
MYIIHVDHGIDNAESTDLLNVFAWAYEQHPERRGAVLHMQHIGQGGWRLHTRPIGADEVAPANYVLYAPGVITNRPT